MDDNIYCTRSDIYGIKIYTINKNKSTILFERKFHTKISNEILVETRLFYEDLDENNKKIVKFKIYTKCENNNKDHFMFWLNISHDYFIKRFKV